MVMQHFRMLLAIGGSKKFTATKPLPMMLDTQGSLARSDKQVAQTFLKHFADIESATIADMDHVVADYNAYAGGRCVPEHTRLTNAQSFRQCIHSLATANPHKAASFDKGSNALFRVAPEATARHLHPLLTKVQLAWHANGPFKLEDGLLKLGLATRLCVEGGAPFLYELRQGKPQWEPDEFDSEMSYPMTATAPGTYPYLRR